MMRHASTVCVISLALVACSSPTERSSDGNRQQNEREDVTETSRAAEPERHAAPTGRTLVMDGHSLQHLDADLTLFDQEGARFSLGSLAGKPALLTFFYGGCTTMCPLIVSDMKRIVAAIPDAQREQLSVVMVTIDPVHDTSERLHALAAERSFPAGWHLVTGDASSIRTIASTVGMIYRPLPDGSFAHAALYTVLDREGRVVHQLGGTGRSIDETVAVLVEQLASAPP